LLVKDVRLRPYALPLKAPWRAASATLATRRGMLIAIVAGPTGWGDCAPLPSSGEAGHARTFAALEEAARGLRGLTLEAGFARLGAIECAEARWAIETALRDVFWRERGAPLRRALNPDARDAVAVNAALGPLDQNCAERAAAALAQGFGFAKIKVGVSGVDEELRLLNKTSSHVEGRLRLRLDANRAWSDADARRFFEGVAHLPIDGVEEPLANPSEENLRRLQNTVPFALAVDESLFEIGAEKLFAMQTVRRLVLKPARIGGFGATLRLAERAAAANMEVVVTSVVDSAIGVAAAAQLAAALGGTQAHGLATGDWLAADVAEPLPIKDGMLKLPDGAGLGIVPKDQFAQF